MEIPQSDEGNNRQRVGVIIKKYLLHKISHTGIGIYLSVVLVTFYKKKIIRMSSEE